jgi:hypothetical protein
MNALSVVSILTGITISGEALALLVGMTLLSPQPNPWVTPLNLFWLGLDILCGAGILTCTLLPGAGAVNQVMLPVILVFSLGAHLYRDWEFLTSHIPSRFLINTPLFVVNNIRLLGLVLILILLAAAWIKTRS